MFGFNLLQIGCLIIASLVSHPEIWRGGGQTENWPPRKNFHQKPSLIMAKEEPIRQNGWLNLK